MSAIRIAGKYISVGGGSLFGKLKKVPFTHDKEMGMFTSSDLNTWIPHQVYNIDNFFIKFGPPSRRNSEKFKMAFFGLEYAELVRSKKPDLYMKLHGDLIDDDVYYWLEKAGIEKDSEDGKKYIVDHVTRKLKGELFKTPPKSEFLSMATTCVTMGCTGLAYGIAVMNPTLSATIIGS